MWDRLAGIGSLPQDPRSAPSAGVKLCTYHHGFGRPQNSACPSHCESLMGNARLQRIFGCCMGPITSQVRSAATYACPGPVMSTLCVSPEH